MKKVSYLSLMLVVGILALTGCRSDMVLNVNDAPINISDKQGASDIKKAIIRSGTFLGWQMKEVAKGHIVATLILRKHVAKVDIKYDRKAYSIKYKDSTNLKYDGESIHSNYNNWIINLNRRIQVELTNMGQL